MYNENRVGLSLSTLAKLESIKARLEKENPRNEGLKLSEIVEYVVNKYESEVSKNVAYDEI